MKKLLFILLLGLSLTCDAQDSLFVKFRPITAAITQESKSTIRYFFQDKKVVRINLNAYFSATGSASKNRILAELRLYIVRQLLLSKGVPHNIITSNIEQKEGNGDLRIVANFASQNKAGVLKKTSLIQVTELNINRATAPQPIIKNDTIASEQEIVLDEAAFKKDAKVSLPNLIFISSSHYFVSSSEKVLQALFKVMKSRPDIEIELQGHVCCNKPGVDALDIVTGQKNLSVMRARAVYEYLLQKGIKGSRMNYRGFGSSFRLYPDEKNATEKMLNRRVEVLITASDSE